MPRSTEADWAAQKQAIIQGLASAGLSLVDPIEAAGALYFADEENAREVAAWFSEEGYEVTVDPLGEGPGWPWRVSAQLETVPTEANFDFLDRHFTDVARRFRGDYFGLEVGQTQLG